MQLTIETYVIYIKKTLFLFSADREMSLSWGELSSIFRTVFEIFLDYEKKAGWFYRTLSQWHALYQFNTYVSKDSKETGSKEIILD